jgi:hypothetical protein
LLLATLLNPGFVPRVSFAGYGEAPLSITLLVAAFLAVEAMEGLAAGIRWPVALVPLALALAAMVDIKQQAPGLVAAFVCAAAVTAARERGIGWRQAARAFAAALVPAVALYLVWRGYVLTRFPTGELKVNPVNLWHLATLWRSLADIGHVVLQKPFQFGCTVLVFGLLWARPRWLSPAARLTARVAAVTFLFYSAFLLAIYVVHFQDEHDFFRYNTHLSLLLVLVLALAARDRLAASPLGRGWQPAATKMALAVMLVAPVAAAPLLRFDQDMPQPRARFAARHLTLGLKDDDRVALVLPDDNKTAGNVLTAMLRFTPPRRRDLDITISTTADADAFAQLARDGIRLAFLSCTDAAPLPLPPGAAALLRFSDGVWSPVAVWPYPPAPPRHWWNWTGYVASQPFCLYSK